MTNFDVKFLASDGAEIVIKVTASTPIVALSAAMNAGQRDQLMPTNVELVEIQHVGS